MKYINVIGTSGSGKSTFSKQLAGKLNLAYIELDDLFWLDDWIESSDQVFFEKLERQLAMHPLGWVIDGNYSRSQHIKWAQVDTIIWIDFPFFLNLYQSTQRAFDRLIKQQHLWSSSNNKESLKMIFSRDSIVLWMIKTHAKNRKKYLSLMQDPKMMHMQFIRLQSRKQVKDWLAQY